MCQTHEAVILTIGAEKPRDLPVTVVVDSLRSALNLGGVLRSCDCFGFERAVLCGYTADPAHPRVVRSAMGCEMRIPSVREDDVVCAIESLKREGVQVVALETTNDAVEVSDFEFSFPCAIVIGNERFGVTASAVSACDAVVSIGMYGNKNSLNVVSAFSICAYSIRQRYSAI